MTWQWLRFAKDDNETHFIPQRKDRPSKQQLGITAGRNCHRENIDAYYREGGERDKDKKIQKAKN